MKSFIVILFFLYVENFGQEVAFPIAPLAQNNFWVYEDSYTKAFRSIKISETAKYVDSIKYFEVEIEGIYKRLFRLRNDGYYVMRSDTSYPEPIHEAIYYKKNARIGDQWKHISGTIAIDETTIVRDTIYYSVIDTALVNFFNSNITVKLLNIRNYGGLLDKEQIWSEEFGLLSDDHGEGFTDNLVGCIINNVLYGDTTITDIAGNTSSIFDYSLSQNYPNPFNPSTQIKYSIKEDGLVTIRVFDMLGKEILVLVNEFKPAGDYEINFNASNPANGTSLSSGIYLYSITSGKFHETKKMILLR